MNFRILRMTLLCVIAFGSRVALNAQYDNTLSAAEIHEGWKLLFDGHTTNGWRGAYMDAFPTKGWVVKDGELRGELSGGMESSDGGDIVTLKKYTSFDLVFDWKLGPGGNSGVKYFVEERRPKPAGSQAGYEYQIIDDAKGVTVAAASSLEGKAKGSDKESAARIGKLIAERAIKQGVKDVVFDRGGYIYHGRIKALADAAREAGLNF